MNMTTTQEKKPRGKKRLPRSLCLILLGILCILLIYSVNSAFIAYQDPGARKITTTLLHYESIGEFDYVATLKDNTFYNNKNTLRPGEGTFFRQLINYVNASFSYTFQINQSANIAGNYSVDAILQTNLWTKTYPLIPRTSFVRQGTTTNFTVNFPLDYAHYESLLTQINQETGVSAQSPVLLIRSSVAVTAKTKNNTVSSYLSPSINVSLNQKTLDISKELTFNQPGSITKSTTIQLPENPAQRMLWKILSIGLIAGVCIVALLTIRMTESQNETTKALKKIKKKYGEWIVETNTYPEVPEIRRITINSLEDLTKISEEIGKPIFSYASPTAMNHRFYILEGMTMYEYIFTTKEEKPIMITQRPTTPASEITPLKTKTRKPPIKTKTLRKKTSTRQKRKKK